MHLSKQYKEYTFSFDLDPKSIIAPGYGPASHSQLNSYISNPVKMKRILEVFNNNENRLQESELMINGVKTDVILQRNINNFWFNEQFEKRDCLNLLGEMLLEEWVSRFQDGNVCLQGIILYNVNGEPTEGFIHRVDKVRTCTAGGELMAISTVWSIIYLNDVKELALQFSTVEIKEGKKKK